MICQKAEGRGQKAEGKSLTGQCPSTPHLSSGFSPTKSLLGVVVGKLHKINVELNEPEYSKAIEAYQERLPVTCKGDLIKEGNTFVLKNPRHFAFSLIF